MTTRNLNIIFTITIIGILMILIIEFIAESLIYYYGDGTESIFPIVAGFLILLSLVGMIIFLYQSMREKKEYVKYSKTKNIEIPPDAQRCIQCNLINNSEDVYCQNCGEMLPNLV